MNKTKAELHRIFEFIRNKMNIRELAILLAVLNGKKTKFTGDILAEYAIICKKYKILPFSKRHVLAMITCLCEERFTDARLISRGRYGRSRLIELTLPEDTIEETSEVIDQICNSLSL